MQKTHSHPSNYNQLNHNEINKIYLASHFNIQYFHQFYLIILIDVMLYFFNLKINLKLNHSFKINIFELISLNCLQYWSAIASFLIFVNPSMSICLLLLFILHSSSDSRPKPF